jgi:hypothetical protein
MQAQDVLELYTTLQEHGVQIWIDGGWGVDALLERQTRPHKDLDAFVAFNDLPAMTTALSQRSFVLKEIWGENRWLHHEEPVLLIGRDEAGDEVATAFVLKDAHGREIDIHVLHIDKHGCGTPAWDCSLSFARQKTTPKAQHGSDSRFASGITFRGSSRKSPLSILRSRISKPRQESAPHKVTMNHIINRERYRVHGRLDGSCVARTVTRSIRPFAIEGANQRTEEQDWVGA